MRKRFVLTISILILLTGLASACNARLKMVSRNDSGTATLTPFLLKATYTSTSPPLEKAGGEGIYNPSPTANVEPAPAEETSQAASTEGETSTPSSTPTPEENLPKVSATLNPPAPTATVKPTKPPATTAPTKPPATTVPTKPPAASEPANPPADTNTPLPPADTNTPQPPTATSPPGECVSSGNAAYENEVIDLINQERTDRGLSALVQNASLTLAARRHSLDMACTDTWSHTGSDGSSPFSRMLDAGYSYSWAAENIATSSSQYFSASSVVSMWMNSSGHRANILSSNAVHIGVGFRFANNGGYDAYYTADFGAPR